MVTDIGDDACSSMSVAEVGTVLGIAHTAGFDRVWIAGGWGVDVTQLALDHLLQAFGQHGYLVEADFWPSLPRSELERIIPLSVARIAGLGSGNANAEQDKW